MKAWNLKQLYEAMQNDLLMCHTQLERTMCVTICRKEIKLLAERVQKERKLTPIEQAILNNIG